MFRLWAMHFSRQLLWHLFPCTWEPAVTFYWSKKTMYSYFCSSHTSPSNWWLSKSSRKGRDFWYQGQWGTTSLTITTDTNTTSKKKPTSQTTRFCRPTWIWEQTRKVRGLSWGSRECSKRSARSAKSNWARMRPLSSRLHANTGFIKSVFWSGCSTSINVRFVAPRYHSFRTTIFEKRDLPEANLSSENLFS